MKINNDAVFIADSHTQVNREKILDILKKLEKNSPSQIFLLGDIANCLMGNINTSIKANLTLLLALKKISNKSQVFYFEGNHDFALDALANLIPRVKIITRKMQPIIFQMTNTNKKILLAHGDLFINKSYELYINTISSKPMRIILKLLDIATFGKLYYFIQKKISRKNIKIPDKELAHIIIRQRIERYYKYLQDNNIEEIYAILEGHFHIKYSDSKDYLNNTADKKFIYIAIPPFYKENSIFYIKDIS